MKLSENINVDLHSELVYEQENKKNIQCICYYCYITVFISSCFCLVS